MKRFFRKERKKMSVNLFLALSNGLGFFPLLKASREHRSLDCFAVINIMGASFFMHLTETKHHLHPQYLSSWSNLFLNFDRFITVVYGSYYGYQFFKKLKEDTEKVTWWDGRSLLKVEMQNLFHVETSCIAVVGIIALGIGEGKTNDPFYNNICYPFFHLIWHGCVYSILYRLI